MAQVLRVQKKGGREKGKPKERITYRDDNVIVGIRQPGWYPLNFHGDEITFLIVRNKRFENIRGDGPCYLNVPQLDSILFVTENAHDKPTIHLFNLTTKKDIKLDPANDSFGNHIGAAEQERRREWLQTAEPDLLVLASRAPPNLNAFYYFNLRKRKIVKIEELYIDKKGTVIKRYVYE